jgi:hypothetical protein
MNLFTVKHLIAQKGETKKADFHISRLFGKLNLLFFIRRSKQVKL